MKDNANNMIKCPECLGNAVETTETISVGSLKKINYRWEVEGKAEIHNTIHGVCRNCGHVYDVIERKILLQFPSLKCPQCKKSEHLVCSAEGVKESESSFTFTASIECKGKACRFKKGLKKAAKSLLDVSNIEVGLSGIKFKKEKSAA